MRYLTCGKTFRSIADARAYAFRSHTSKYTSWKEEIHHVNRYGIFLSGILRYDGHRKELYWHTGNNIARVTKNGRVYY